MHAETKLEENQVIKARKTNPHLHLIRISDKVDNPICCGFIVSIKSLLPTEMHIRGSENQDVAPLRARTIVVQ
jgi:hypothetical protein